MRRMLALLAAVGLVASLGPASVVAAPTTQPNSFHGDFDMLDQGSGQAVGHIVVDLHEQTNARQTPGSLDVYWASGSPIRKSHARLSGVWFGQEFLDPGWGAVRSAGATGTICDTGADGATCGDFSVIFEQTVSPEFTDYVGWSVPGSSECCGGAWYQVGKGAFALSYLGSASKVSVAAAGASGPMQPGASRAFRATVKGAADPSVYWSVKEPDGGSITSNGVYTAPATPGTYTVTATSQADVRASTSIRVPVVIPVGHIPGYDVGVDYHAYGADFGSTGFLNQYQDPAIRQIFRAQLQGMADRGATVISTRIWLVNGDGRTTGAGETWEAAFPISDQQKRNLRAYAQDVAAVRGAGGNRLRLDLCLLWLWDADYTTGSPATGLGQSGLSATEFTSRVAVTTDRVLAAVAGVKRPDGVPVVDTIYLDGEVMIGAKANQDWFLTTHYPRFVKAVSKAGFRPSLYFNASDTAQDYLDPGYVDVDYPILDGHRSMFWVYRSLRFIVDHGLPLPDRVDFSWYVPATADASSATLLARVLDDADATLPSLGLPKKYGIAETFYYPDPTQRRELGQAIAAQALANPRLQRVCFWTTPVGIGGASGPAYPFAIEDFYPPAN
jgi:hypothetical protein